MQKLRVGVVGLGFMGSAHVGNYKILEEKGLPVTLVAICDVDTKKMTGAETIKGNLDAGQEGPDYSAYAHYTDMLEMIQKENLDFVDLCLPTYLHGPMTVKALDAGVHVFCEKPMSLDVDMCRQMIEASKRAGKKLMIGHCLRYWDAYEYLKEAVDDARFGKVVSAYFFRGGVLPTWSWENWLMDKNKSGGCLLDQHVHDVDIINWLFGMPCAVSSVGKNVIEGGGYDAVSTNYIYNDKVVNAQDDWTINGDGFNFEHTYRVNFEKGAIVFKDGKVFVYPVDGKMHEAELSGIIGYYKELQLFVGYLQDPDSFDHVALLESHMDSIRLANAEMESCDKYGEKISL